MKTTDDQTIDFNVGDLGPKGMRPVGLSKYLKINEVPYVWTGGGSCRHYLEAKASVLLFSLNEWLEMWGEEIELLTLSAPK